MASSGAGRGRGRSSRSGFYGYCRRDRKAVHTSQSPCQPKTKPDPSGYHGKEGLLLWGESVPWGLRGRSVVSENKHAEKIDRERGLFSQSSSQYIAHIPTHSLYLSLP